MKYLKIYENFEHQFIESDIVNYLEDNFSQSWFDEKIEREARHYISPEEASRYGGYVEAYMNLSTGNPIEIDILAEMCDEVFLHFSIPIYYGYNKKINTKSIYEICDDYMYKKTGLSLHK